MHQWLVKQGRIALSREQNHVRLEIDPEGGDSCHLTIQDTIDISKILTQYFREIWVENPENDTDTYEKKLIMISQRHYCWMIEEQKLEIFLDNECDFLQIRATSPGQMTLNVCYLSEIAQILEYFVNDTIAELRKKVKKKWWQFWK